MYMPSRHFVSRPSHMMGLEPVGDAVETIAQVVNVARPFSMAAGAYHGYKRNQSVGWAIGWALLGFMSPVIAMPVALAQGFGTRKGA